MSDTAVPTAVDVDPAGTIGPIPPWAATNKALGRLVARIEGADRLDEPARALGRAVEPVLHRRGARSVLSGTFLGHPLHPVLTDVAIGMLQGAALLDLVAPGRATRRAATTLLATGLVAAVPTAATGLSDWSDTTDGDRRVGLVHGATNGVGTVLFGLSLVTRLRGARRTPRVLSALGWATLSVGAWLGGHLVHRRGVGVDHTAFEQRTDGWTAVGPLDEVPEGVPHRVEVDGTGVLVVRLGVRVHALEERCTHAGGPLAEGEVDLDALEVTCPWHHSCFGLRDGVPTRGPATAPQPTWGARVVDGDLQLRPATA